MPATALNGSPQNAPRSIHAGHKAEMFEKPSSLDDNDSQHYLPLTDRRTVLRNRNYPIWERNDPAADGRAQAGLFMQNRPVDPFVASDNTRVSELLEGRCTFSQIDFDLQIHVNDTLEMASAHASFVIPPKLTVVLMLEGDLDAAIDGRPLAMTAQRGPTGYLWINRQPARLERWIRAGQRVRKITISLPLAKLSALSDVADDVFSDACAETDRDITVMQWQANAQSLRSAEEILKLDADESSADRLSSSIAALTVVRNALSQLDDRQTTRVPQPMSTRDVNRARLAREFILQHIDRPLPIKEVARSTGMSISTLQRVFKGCFGATVMEFVRTRRLELARLALLEDGVTVGEAAFSAGYSSPANFSTAFQREFGYPPSSCTRN